MEKLILKDNTEIEILPGAYLGKICAMVTDFENMKKIMESVIKPGNLDEIKFMSGDIAGAEYKNMVLQEPNFRITKKADGIEVDFGLRERTKEEEQQEDVQTALTYLTDEQALTVKDLYTDWEDDPVGYEYKTENSLDLRRNYNNGLWKLKKSHAKQLGWYPGADPTLWEQIVEGHEGTLEDPIPVPDSVTTSGFTYIYGKYYKEGEEIYLAKREGKNDGEEETLYFAPSALIGQYFEKVG